METTAEGMAEAARELERDWETTETVVGAAFRWGWEEDTALAAAEATAASEEEVEEAGAGATAEEVAEEVATTRPPRSLEETAVVATVAGKAVAGKVAEKVVGQAEEAKVGVEAADSAKGPVSWHTSANRRPLAGRVLHPIS